jgi:DNA invertase Pin-like site-specific DNA recombinase
MKNKINHPKIKAAGVEVYGYCRVSGKDQENGHGFDRQEDAIRNFATFKNFQIADIIRDVVTGANEWADRNGFNRMVKAMRENGVKTVVIEHQDRLARELLIQELIIRDFRREGFTIWSTEGGELTAEDNDEMRQFRGIMAQSDKKRLVKKLRTAREHIRKTEGRCEGIRPYGELEGEREIVDRIVAMRTAGKTLKQIVNELNNDNVPTRVAVRKIGGQIVTPQWRVTTIHGILKAAGIMKNRIHGRGKKNVAAGIQNNPNVAQHATRKPHSSGGARLLQ